MHGMKRVIVFCIFIVVLPAILIITPLYLRHSVFADIIYPVAESDIIEIRDGISSIFCEKHALHMNTTFNAFQLQSKPEISTNRKHIRLKKSMTLPDDTLEYWGFYLLKGAIVKLKVCSRYDGSRILLVKGDRNLKTCGLLEHNKNKFDAHYAGGYGVVNVTFEPIAEEIVSEENGKQQEEQQQQEEQKQSTLSPVLLQNQNNNHQNYESGAGGGAKLSMMNNNNRQGRNNFETTNFNDHRGVGGGGDGDGRIQKRNRHHTMTSVKEIKIKKNADRNRFENFDRNDENHGGEDYSDDENDNDGGGGGDNDNSNISGNSSNKNVNINSNSLVNKLQLTKYENKFFNILESQNNNNNNQKNIKINVKNNGGHNDANNNDKSSLISKLETEFENLSNNNSSGSSSNSNESINNNTTNSNERIFKHNDDNKRIRHKRHYHNKKQQQEQQQTTQQKHHHHHHHHHHQYKNVVEEEEQKHMKALQDEHYKRKKEIMKQLFDENNRLSKSKQYQIKNNPQHQQQQHNQIQNHLDDHMEQNQQQTLHLLNKRDTVYDAKIAHGGNALNFTDTESNSVSSFENSLLTCYDGQILLAKSFNPSSLCTSVHYLANSTHMIATHEIQEDGYYYYIFYSDNDLFRNDIHALFDIYKPTYQYTNVTDSKGCVNETDCLFPIKFLSDEIVVVEVPTRDGIEHEEDDITYLISTCHPRMSVYIIFPISVLILILSCSFL